MFLFRYSFQFCSYTVILTSLHSYNTSVLEFEQVYLDNLPSSESYEKSYMHRDFITHIVVTG